MRVGILFGGQSREREISFAGGRTVYDNLNKALFNPVPLFIDSLGNFILLDWENIYKGTIRDFYPHGQLLPQTDQYFQLYIESLSTDTSLVEEAISKIGRRVSIEELPNLIDFAFLTLHGPYGEDGNIQGMLEWLKIPYSGASILPCSIGIDKEIQKKVYRQNKFKLPHYKTVQRRSWLQDAQAELQKIEKDLDYPLVVKSPHQGSSIGISIVHNREELEAGIDKGFFRHKIDITSWKTLSYEDKHHFLITFTDIREGLGFPVYFEGGLIYRPDQLWKELDACEKESVVLTCEDTESSVIIEDFIKGKEFSCIVIEDENGQPLALPPTEIIKGKELFDYRTKYLPGLSHKETPMRLPTGEIKKIQKGCEKLFDIIHSDVYARIDGFYGDDGEVYLNDPNTTSGMLPSSFFFHQTAEIGLNPSEIITYIIRTSLAVRARSGKSYHHIQKLISELDQNIADNQDEQQDKMKVAVLMGGFSAERHISIESGRNIYEKLASSDKYLPIPVFLTGALNHHEMYRIPINIMMKDNADDIRDKIKKSNDTALDLSSEAIDLRDKYAKTALKGSIPLTYEQLASQVDFVFIGLHGRPGEDGAVQQHLDQVGLPYNGSGVESSQTTINKYKTNHILREQGILVAAHQLVTSEEYLQDRNTFFQKIEEKFKYPFIAKPADDGCSAAVKKIKDRAELEAFTTLMFRQEAAFPKSAAETLQLKFNEEFPQKATYLIEDLITSNGAEHFLEITGGMITSTLESGTMSYDVFQPSEALASGEVLSLEEKFLAGEGQNITPARFSSDPKRQEEIATKVRAELEKVAKILNVQGYCRIDAFVRIFKDKVETVIIEVNSLPGMTPATAIFHQAAIAGFKPHGFIDALIEEGIARQQSNLSVSTAK
ncbi:MAG: D-alanine--D-alanine ligase [Cyclobacteriaceae bacterium]|nr:D-alanine--D-alanine ligase [Cyclobacteriaceae bacterium HetDA_MAG_MS6]